ncbi:MAG: 4Fe-4S binding protein [Eubacterium sp.]|nr:4Fe-4S binding protein [Eubacterium sp.]
MITFNELHRHVLKAKKDNTPLPKNLSRKEQHQLDCLLHPDDHPLVWKMDTCDCKDGSCVAACTFSALTIQDGQVSFDPEKCTGCAKCIEACKNENLTFSHDSVKALELLKDESHPVYALMAPAFIGQFGETATPSKIRTALKQIGFSGMIEVAAFADILTLKEALEFYHNMQKPDAFQLTSCCCPVWIKLIRKDFSKIVEHLPASVSPMIACGRVAKQLHKGCRTIFIGPCLAKKAEAKEPDLKGAIDCVLTFEELDTMFATFQVDFSHMKEEVKEHSASAGRLYARTGGVSQAVRECVRNIDTDCQVDPVCANGVSNCKKLLQDILEGNTTGNFFEGMACDGGCVGGPKRVIPMEQGKALVDAYAKKALYRTPAENPYVIDLIQRLGFFTIEEFLKNSDILTRSL